MWLPGSHSLEANATELLHLHYSQTNIIACQSLSMHSLTTCWQVWWHHIHLMWKRGIHKHTQAKVYVDGNTPTYLYSHIYTQRCNTRRMNPDMHTHSFNQAASQKTCVHTHTHLLGETQGEGNRPLHLKWRGSPLAKLDSAVSWRS